MSHKILLSYLIGAQSLVTAGDFDANDVIEAFGGSEDDVDLLLSAVRVKLENIRSGRETIGQLIQLIDDVAEHRGGEVSCEDAPEELMLEIEHMNTLFNKPSLGMVA